MPGNTRPILLWNAALIAAGAIFVSYGVLYFFPASGDWKTIPLGFLFAISSFWSTVTAALLWHVHRTDPGLRRVWLSFAIALGLWCLAEGIWTLQTVFSGAKGLGLADIFWVGGYLFFGIALYAQYKLLLIPPKWLSRTVFAAILLLSLALSFSFAFILARHRGETLNLENWLAAFYPVGDLAIGAGALYIAHLFRGGIFSRPWLGMLLFAIADSLYAWMNLSQAKYLLESGSLTLYVSDSLYLVAYLAVGLACFMQWLTLRYGFFYATKS